MSQYATQDDLTALYGEDMLRRVAEREGNGNIDIDAVERALIDASAEIDLYVAARYAPAVVAASRWVRIATINIAVYFLANNFLSLTPDIRQRYEDVLSTLKRIGEGKAGIGDHSADAPGQDGQDGLSTLAFGFVRRG